MANDKNYYDVLGVEPDADVTIIKRRYRQLVRANHPDIAPDRDSAHQKMLEINAAWTILSDPSERARYDRSRRDPLGRETTGDGPVVSRKTSGADEYINSAASRPRAAGAGSSSAARPAARPARASRNASRGSSQSRTRLLTMVFEAAELYFFQGRAEEAIQICERVIKADPNNAEAPALLGDIYAEQGRKDVAVKMYQTAVHNQPGNALYRQKLSALTGAPAEAPPASGARTASTAGRSSSARSAGRNGVRSSRPGTPDAGLRGSQYRESVAKSKQSRANAGMIMMLASLACLGIGNFAIDPAALELPIIPPAPTLGGGLLIFTAVSGLLLGVALPLLGIVGPTAKLRPNQPKWQGWPLFVIVLIAAVLCYPSALVILSIMHLGRRDFDKSWIIMAFAALVWTFTMAFRAEDTQVPALLMNSVLWWAGRLVYPPLALGWVLGSTQVRN